MRRRFHETMLGMALLALVAIGCEGQNDQEAAPTTEPTPTEATATETEGLTATEEAQSDVTDTDAPKPAETSEVDEEPAESLP